MLHLIKKPSHSYLILERKTTQGCLGGFESYDTIDYRDILEMTDFGLHDMIDWSNGNIVRDNTNPKWLRKVNIDDEVDIIIRY